MPIKMNTDGFESTGGDKITIDDNLIMEDYLKVGDASETASTAGAGALKYSSKILLSNGSQWLPIYLERDGTSDKPIFYLDDVADLGYTTDQTMYVNPHGVGEKVQYTIDFTNTSAPKYQTSSTGTANGNYGTIYGECVGQDGSKGQGACTQGTGSSYSVYKQASWCMKAGMRLCTRTEIKGGAAKGSGCSHDNRAIWTSTGNGSGSYYAVQGNWVDTTQVEQLLAGDGSSTISGFSTNEIGSRCCHPSSGVSLWEF